MASQLVLVVSVVAMAPWLAGSWLKAETLSVAAAIRAFHLMGALIGLRWLAGLYRGAITGLQDLVWLNVTSAAFATLRGAGVVPVLIWISPTIDGFFLYQAVITLMELVVLFRRSWSLLPSRVKPRFSVHALRRIWRFSAGVTIITLLYLLLNQADKVLLSTMLSLKAFGYYALASSVAGSLNLLIAPIGGVAYPRLTELVARGDQGVLAENYHRFAQMLTLAIAPAALVLALFSDHILLLWIQDATTGGETAPLVTLLAVGVMLNAFLSTPHMLQLALGRTRFIIALNSVYVLVFVPAIYVGVSAYGAIASGVCLDRDHCEWHRPCRALDASEHAPAREMAVVRQRCRVARRRGPRGCLPCLSGGAGPGPSRNLDDRDGRFVGTRARLFRRGIGLSGGQAIVGAGVVASCKGHLRNRRPL